MANSPEGFVIVEKDDAIERDENGILPATVEEIATLKSWLKCTEYDSEGSELSKNQNQYTHLTGQWLTETQEYQTLMSTDTTGILFISGNPGTGKSVISARLVNEFKAAAGSPVCFFFFREIVNANRSERAMLVDLLAQMLHFSPVCAKSLSDLSEKGSRKVEDVSMGTLWRVFDDAAAAMHERILVIVLDAFDECDPRDISSCLARLSEFADKYREKVKIVATGRPNPEIQNGFKHCKAVINLALTPENVDSDIACYASLRLKDSIPDLGVEKREDCINRLVDRAKGLFLYARLMLDEMIADERGDLAEALPNGISEMYDHLLEKHRIASGHTIEKQILVLQAVVFSTGTMSLGNLACIYNIDLGERALDMPMLDTKAALRRICGPLLEVKGEFVHIVHHSFTEFLTNKDGVRGSREYTFPVLVATEGHRALCDVCITYLNLERFRTEGKNVRGRQNGCVTDPGTHEWIPRLMQYPLSKYAAENWGYHARLGEVDDERLMARMTRHLGREAEVYTQLRGDGLISYPLKFSPLHMAARFGIAAYVVYLLSNGADIEGLDDKHLTPAMLAAKDGHVDVLNILHGHGCRLDFVDNKQRTLLYSAARHGHHLVVRRLLQLGLDPNAQAAKPRRYNMCWEGTAKAERPPPIYTPVRIAIKHGHAKALAEMLPHLTPENAILPYPGPNPQKRKTILHYAAAEGHAAVVSTILTSGLVDVNALDERGRTPLLRAVCGHGNGATALALLQHGANPRLKGPLHACASRSKHSSWSVNRLTDTLDIASQLLGAGADINEKDAKGNTPLLLAAKGHPMIFDWFLKHGADVNVRNGLGQSALHLCYRVENVKALLAADIDWSLIDGADDIDGSNPLLSMVKNCSRNVMMLRSEFKEVFEVMMRHGASILMPNKRGECAYFYAIENVETYAGEIPGYDPRICIRDSRGRSLLHLNSAIYQGGSFPEWLNLNVQDHEGNTPLHLRMADVAKLLAAGANPNIPNKRGDYPLHTFLSHGKFCPNYNVPGRGGAGTENLENLISRADLGVRDALGNTAVHIAAQCWVDSADLLRKALEAMAKHGADVSSRNLNNAGQTALHLAAGARSGANIAVLLEVQGSEALHCVDHQGRVALHYAAGSPSKTGVGVKLLLEAHSWDGWPSSADGCGRTPLHFAARAGNANALLVLTTHLKMTGKEVPAVADYDGVTPLHDAAQSGSYASVKVLLDAGMTASTPRTHDGRTALHAAAAFSAEDDESQSGEPPRPFCHRLAWSIRQKPRPKDVVRLLLQAGVDPDVVDDDGETALVIAGRNGHYQVIEALHEAAIAKDPGVDKDIVRWAAGQVNKGFVSGREQYTLATKEGKREADRMIAFQHVMVTASISSTVVDTFTQMAALMGPWEALWQAAAGLHEQALLSLLESNYDFVALAEAQPRRFIEHHPLSPGHTFVGSIIDALLHYIIVQGWTRVLPYAISKLGIRNGFLGAVTHSRDPNVEMLRLVAPLIQDPHLGLGHITADGDPVERLSSSVLPWYPEAVRVVLQEPHINAAITAGMHRQGGPRILHRLIIVQGARGGKLWAEDTLRIYLEAKVVEVNDVYAGGATPLEMFAIWPGNLSLVRLLIEAGADVNYQDLIASSSACPETVKLLLSAGARMPKNHYVMMRTICLKPHAMQEKLKAFKILLKAGLDVNAHYIPKEEDKGAGPELFPKSYEVHRKHGILHLAVSRGIQAEMLEALLRVEGIDIDIRDARGRTPLHVACYSAWKEWPNPGRTPGLLEASDVALRLLSAGASAVAVDDHGFSVLDCVFMKSTLWHGSWQIIQALLRSGAAAAPSQRSTVLLSFRNLRFQDACGVNTHYDPHIPPWAILEVLKSGGGARRAVRDEQGNTPMHLFLPKYLAFIEVPPMDEESRNALGPKVWRMRCEEEGMIPPGGRATQALYDEIFELLLEHAGTADGRNVLFEQNLTGETALHVGFRECAGFSPHALGKVLSVVGGITGVVSLPRARGGRSLLHALVESDVRAKGWDAGNGHLSDTVRWEMERRRERVVERVEMFGRLVEWGFDPQEKDGKGLSALEVAEMMGHEEVVERFASV